MIKRSVGERTFNVINIVILTLAAISMLFPLLNVLAKSLSSNVAVTSGLVGLLPKDFQLDTYKYVLKDSQVLSSLKVTVLVTAVGTAGSMLVTIMTAYPLSKKDLKGRRVMMLMIMFAMLFNGGMVPNYLIVKSLGLLNNIGALILPNMLNIFNMIIVKSFFEELPESVEESARLDGASNMRILFNIVLPMSLPIIASVGLFYTVDYWNTYFNAVMYITKPSLKPLQQYLYDLVTQSSDIMSNSTGSIDQMMNISSESVRCASIIVATLPILCAYPFLQKYFVKGLTVGAVKG